MEESKMGTVTPVSSMFPAEEAKKAAKLVKEKINEKRAEMARVGEFIADNNNIIKLVKELPNKLHHDIMVPFGKAAFFPGRLIHTNECLVLLGEGYSADRTAKQTIGILKRRGTALETQVQSLMTVMQDLKAEESFFNNTALEAEEGVVEIREDYVEETVERLSESDAGQHDSSIIYGDAAKNEVDDEEYGRMMSRLDELEIQELGTDNEDSSDEAQQIAEVEKEENSLTNAKQSGREADKDDQANPMSHKFLEKSSGIYNAGSSEESQPKKSSQPAKQNTSREDLSVRSTYQENFTDQSNCTGLTVKSISREKTTTLESSPQHMNSKPVRKSRMGPEETAKRESAYSVQNMEPDQKSKSGFDGSKAFTGSIIEHADNLPTNRKGQTVSPAQSTSSQPSKPVSRFKMQRREGYQ